MKLKNISTTGEKLNSCRHRGFTLVELLLVLTILAILASIVLPNMTKRTGDARITKAKVEIENFRTALSVYELDNGSLPRPNQGLQALLVKPNDLAGSWKGPYLQLNKIPADPWNNPYIYELPGRHYPKSYDLYSKGPDGVGGTNTIGNWVD